VALSDGDLMAMSSALLGPGDVAFGISHTGASRDVTDALDRMRTAGWVLEEADAACLRTADELLGPIILYEMWRVHRERHRTAAGGYGPGTAALLEMASRVTADEYRQATAERERATAAVARLFDEFDVLAGPTVAYQAPPQDPPVGTPEGEVESRFTGPWNVVGMPVVSLPCPVPDGQLPVGLQLAAAAGGDVLLVSIAAAQQDLVR